MSILTITYDILLCLNFRGVEKKKEGGVKPEITLQSNWKRIDIVLVM